MGQGPTKVMDRQADPIKREGQAGLTEWQTREAPTGKVDKTGYPEKMGQEGEAEGNAARQHNEHLPGTSPPVKQPEKVRYPEQTAHIGPAEGDAPRQHFGHLPDASPPTEQAGQAEQSTWKRLAEGSSTSRHWEHLSDTLQSKVQIDLAQGGATKQHIDHLPATLQPRDQTEHREQIAARPQSDQQPVAPHLEERADYIAPISHPDHLPGTPNLGQDQNIKIQTGSSTHAPGRPPNQTPRKRQRPAKHRPQNQQQLLGTSPRVPYTKGALLSMVDTRGVGPVNEYLEIYDPYFRRYAQPDGPRIVVSDQPHDISFPTRDELDGPHTLMAARLGMLISTRRRMPHRVTLTSIYEAYRELPEPRMMHISAPMRHALLEVLGTPAKKTSRGMLRYFSVVTDVKSCGLTLKRSEWNYAMALAGRYAGWSTDTEVAAAMRLWRDMEVTAGIPANDVTFNILFDVASKAGNFTLAEMMIREMESRGIRADRFYHVSLINFFGLKSDPDGVRAAYKEMVEAGQMIDTMTLNCVINGLLRSGDEDAAENIYDRMLHPPDPTPRPPLKHDYASGVIITRVLKMFGRISARQPSARPSLQRQVSILPDARTYRILLDHYTARGNIQRVVRLLDEMQWARVRMNGRLYMALFKGFAKHGTRLRGAWSEQRLQAVHHAFLQALKEGSGDIYMTKWLALWILRAFAKCSSRLVVFDIYVHLKRVGNFDETSIAFLDQVTTNMMNKIE
jgi:pentatricopeptide repeat protein